MICYFLLLDNASVNPAIARKLGIPFYGCASHKFNLAMGKILANYKVHTTKIAAIMDKVQASIKIKLAVFEKCRLGAIIHQETR